MSERRWQWGAMAGACLAIGAAACSGGGGEASAEGPPPDGAETSAPHEGLSTDAKRHGALSVPHGDTWRHTQPWTARGRPGFSHRGAKHHHHHEGEGAAAGAAGSSGQGGAGAAGAGGPGEAAGCSNEGGSAGTPGGGSGGSLDSGGSGGSGGQVMCPDGFGQIPGPDSTQQGDVVHHRTHAEYVQCVAEHSNEYCQTYTEPTQIYLNYGAFPFGTDLSLPPASYVYSVIAPGYEQGGFLDGAPGNLSDTAPSEAPCDTGSGDTAADRTVVPNNGQFHPQTVPASWGTHPLSFDPSQWALIRIAPFDLTPDGKYTLAICRAGSSSICDCRFERFTVTLPPAPTAP